MKKKRFPLFWILYVLFVAVMVVFWIRVVKYVNVSLVQYEDSQPEYFMEKVMDAFRENGLDQYMTVAGEISRFEKPEDYREEFKEQMQGKILFHLPAKGYQDPTAPKYELFADAEHIGYCSLKETSATPFFLNLLTMSEWELGEVELEALQGTKSVDITIPEACTASVNGIQMDERELTGAVSESEEFIYVKEYVDVPKFVSYHTEGLLRDPLIEIKNAEGEVLLTVHGTEIEDSMYEVSVDNNITSVTAKGFQESEMPEDLREMVLENTERYTNFFSVDLPGARGSISPIKDMFPQDSYYLELAETYRREDMWMYSSHNAPVFKNESVSHYIRYSEDLFSCEVYFDKEMLLHKTGKIKVDTTNFRLYYGLLDGKWKILDIVTLLGSEE